MKEQETVAQSIANNIKPLVKARKDIELSYALFACAKEFFERGRASLRNIDVDLSASTMDVLNARMGRIEEAYRASTNIVEVVFALHKKFKYMPKDSVESVVDILERTLVENAKR